MKVKILILSSLIALTACSGEHDDLQSWMTQQRNEAKTRIHPVSKPAPLEPVTYVAPQLFGSHAFNSARMRSASQNANAPDLNRARELLENYSLENLNFVGSIGSSQNLSALIEVDGHVYTVKPGNYVGQNHGRISKITPDTLEIIEVVEDADGNWVNRPATLSSTPSDGSETKNK